MTELVSLTLGQNAINSTKLANEKYCLQCDETCQINLWYTKFISFQYFFGVWQHGQPIMCSLYKKQTN